MKIMHKLDRVGLVDNRPSTNKNYMWHVTPDTGHLTPDTWHLTHDMWHMVVGEHFLKISAPQLLWFGIDSTLNIFPQTMSQSVNELIN